MNVLDEHLAHLWESPFGIDREQTCFAAATISHSDELPLLFWSPCSHVEDYVSSKKVKAGWQLPREGSSWVKGSGWNIQYNEIRLGYVVGAVDISCSVAR